MNNQITHFFEQTQKEVIEILSIFHKSFLRIKIMTKLFNLNKIIYIVVPILKSLRFEEVYFSERQDQITY